jgi:hypothetical protein
MTTKSISRPLKISMMVTGIYVVVMTIWLLWDGVVQVAKVSHLPAPQFWVEPIVWHKLGEPLLALPIVLFLAGGYFLWRKEVRESYLRWTTPLMVLGGICEFIAAYLFYQRGNTDFIFWFSLILGVVGLVAPFGLRLAHQRVTQKEANP